MANSPKKHRPSLEALTAAAVAPAASAKVVEFAPAPVRVGKAHTTLYLDRKAQRVIKEIALQFDKKAHDLYLEGIDLMLAQYGRPSLKDIVG